MNILLVWAINAISLLLLPYVFESIHIDDFWTALIVALLLGLVNAVIRPILILLTLPVTLLTLGLFILVINALLFWFIADVVEGFRVGGFWSAFFGAILYSLISWGLSALLFKQKKA